MLLNLLQEVNSFRVPLVADVTLLTLLVLFFSLLCNFLKLFFNLFHIRELGDKFDFPLAAELLHLCHLTGWRWWSHVLLNVLLQRSFVPAPLVVVRDTINVILQSRVPSDSNSLT